MATLATNVSFQCLGLDGKPLAGGKVYTYEAGTTTPKSTYTTMAGDVPNSNPVILDQNGKAKIFLGDGAYRLRVLDSNEALVDDIDQISRYVTQSEFATFQQTVQDEVHNQKGFANGIAPLDPNVKIDPIYLPALPNTAIPKATETALGVVELATQTEVNTGTDTERAVTPATLKSTFPTQTKTALSASGNAPIYACRAWANFSGVSTVTIHDSQNIASITRTGVGTYQITFINPMPHANYAILASPGDGSRVFSYDSDKSTTGFIGTYHITDQGYKVDGSFISLAIFC